MPDGDFFSAEKSHICEAGELRIEHVGADGATTVLKPSVKVQKGEVIDATRMSAAKLREYIEAELTSCKADNLMVSLHLKATMMKISDPILFGHVVSVYFKDAFAKHDATLKKLGVNPNNGLASIFDALKKLPDAERAAVEADFNKCYETRPGLAMVDSDRGITNLYLP
jgi:isocitrate dehydrogenase